MEPPDAADRFLDCLTAKFPSESVPVKNEIESLKRKLENMDDEFSDCDEEQLVYEVEKVENELKKRKIEFTCDICGKIYRQKRNKIQHMKTHCMSFKCQKCNKPFSRDHTRKQHEKKCTHELKESSKSKSFTCKHCEVPFESYDDLFQHVIENHPLKKEKIQKGGDAQNSIKQKFEKDEPQFSLQKSSDKARFVRKGALNDAVNQMHILPAGNEQYDVLQFFSTTKSDVENELKMRGEKVRDLKWYLNVRVEMVRDVNDGVKEKATPHFRSKAYIALENGVIEHNLNEAFQKMNASLEEFIHKGSNWVVNKVIELEVNTIKYSPISGSNYMELPPKIRFTGGIINVQNQDQRCFLWSILAALHPVEQKNYRTSQYTQYEDTLNFNGIDFPVPLSKIEKFEKQNGLSINVFGYEEGQVFPLYLSKMGNNYKEINLLYLSDEDNSHYCWIKNLSRFLSHTNKHHGQRYYCHRCLHAFIRQDLLDAHRPYCDQFDFQKVEYPKEGQNFLQFKDFHKAMRVPFVIYADFEALAVKIDTCLPNPDASSSTHQVKFEACGYGYQVVCTNDKYSKSPVIYRGEKAAEHLFDNLFKEEEYIKNILNDMEPLIMTKETESQFQKATHCYICNRMFTDKLIKNRDHSHIGITGDNQSTDYSNYRGAACQSCNLNLQNPTFIPILFHNFRGFDSHLLTEAVGKYKDKNITCIPNNMEKYISFSVGGLRFLDSYQFMSESLEKLVDNLAVDGLTHFHHFQKTFQDIDIAKLLLRKNVYCYDYVDHHDKFQKTSLPPREAFYNRLKNEHITDADYAHAQNVWTTLSMHSLGEYHDLYLKTDVLLLADVFERFRTMTLEFYGLDACHFLTAPGLAWQAALKMSGICLDLLTEPEMFNFCELSCRGGVSMISKRYARANNPYVDEYDETKPNSYLMYFDANNLYGWAMSQPLPTGLMCWLDEHEIECFDLHSIPIDAKKGYMLEVDLEYPAHLHETHNDYPLAPSHKTVQDDELSTYGKGLHADIYGMDKRRPKTEKLIPTLEKKTNYIVHYRNLQLYTKLGMKITKIHRILEFHQSPWLASYIRFNTMKRQLSKNAFEKNFFKLMNNSVFGKTMENLRNRVNIKLVNNEKSLRKYVSKPSFQRFQIFNEDLVGIENKVTNLVLNKPVYVGSAILDLSKTIMYDFHYNIMIPRYGSKLNLLFTDTDSLMYEIFTDDIYQDMEQFQDYFDTSDYNPSHPLHSVKNKKIPGVMKDECSGTPIKELIGLRSKMYSLITHQQEGDDVIQKEKRTAKGIAKSAIEHQLRHIRYKQCLFENKMTVNDMNLIRSQNHVLYVNSVRKIGLCNFDDKRYWKNSINGYAYGHYKIPKHSKMVQCVHLI